MGDVGVRCVAGVDTLMSKAGCASAQDLKTSRRASLLALKMRGLHGTDGIRALVGQF